MRLYGFMFSTFPSNTFNCSQTTPFFFSLSHTVCDISLSPVIGRAAGPSVGPANKSASPPLLYGDGVSLVRVCGPSFIFYTGLFVKEYALSSSPSLWMSYRTRGWFSIRHSMNYEMQATDSESQCWYGTVGVAVAVLLCQTWLKASTLKMLLAKLRVSHHTP